MPFKALVIMRPQSFRSAASWHIIYFGLLEVPRNSLVVPPCRKSHLRQPEVRNSTSLSCGIFFNKTLNQIILQCSRLTPRQPTPVRQKPFEIRQKLAYIASSTPKIFGVTYQLSSMALKCHVTHRPESRDLII